MVVAELLRIAMGEKTHEVVDGDLRSTVPCQAVIGNSSGTPFNPGFTHIINR